MSIFRKKEPVSFSVLTISVTGTMACSTEYELTRTDTGMTAAKYEGSWNYDEDTERKDCLEKLIGCTEEQYEMINGLVNSCDAVKWNGKRYSNPHVLDGESFSFKMLLADGREISCSGTNSYPKNYHTLFGTVTKLF